MEVAVASPLAGTVGSKCSLPFPTVIRKYIVVDTQQCDIFRRMDIPKCQKYCLLNIVLLVTITFLHRCSSYPSCYVVLEPIYKKVVILPWLLITQNCCYSVKHTN